MEGSSSGSCAHTPACDAHTRGNQVCRHGHRCSKCGDNTANHSTHM
jgi:hypothetical protein